MNTTEESTMNQTIAQKKVLAAKPKRPYKRQTKAARVRKLLTTGMPIAEIVTKAKVTPSYVYHVRWQMNKEAGIGSLEKKKKKKGTVSENKTSCIQQITYVDEVPYDPAVVTPVIIPTPAPAPAPAPVIAAPTPAPTFWQRVRNFLGL